MTDNNEPTLGGSNTSKAGDPANVTPMNPGEITGYGDIGLDDAANAIETVQRQFFALPVELASSETCRNFAVGLLTDVLVPLNRDFAIVSLKGSIMIADLTTLKEPKVRDPKARAAWLPSAEPSLMSERDFKLLLADRTCQISKNRKLREVCVADVWLAWKGRRIYRQGFTFAPGVKQSDLSSQLNLWRGWGVDVDLNEPERPECWAKLRDHLKIKYCHGNEKHYMWLISWLSDIFKNPMRKPGSALVIRGIKGTGKTMLADVMKKIIGEQFFSRIEKPEQLVGQFNARLQNNLLLNPEESFWSGSKAAEGVLKNIITSENVELRRMRTDGFQIKNFSRVMITSNENWVVPATFDERRFFVIDCSPEDANSKPYFRALWDELIWCGGFEEFTKYLMNFEAPSWVNLAYPPKTDALARQAEESLTIPQRFFWRAVKHGDGFPCDMGGEFFRSDVHSAYDEWCQKRGDRYAAINDRLFADLMAEFWCAEKVGRRHNPATGQKETLYRVPSLDEVRGTLMLAKDLADDAFDADNEDEDEDVGQPPQRHLRRVV